MQEYLCNPEFDMDVFMEGAILSGKRAAYEVMDSL